MHATDSSAIGTAPLTEVYRNDNFQLTGISVSQNGRLFVNFPRWSDRYKYAVVEVKPDGSTIPFPDESWNLWDLKAASAAEHFVCVQSVVVDKNDTLWIVDAGAPLLGPVVENGPKLVLIDLKTNRVDRTIPFGSDVALADSYMNDIRIDIDSGTAYLTDSGHGGIVVVDITGGTAHRALDGHPSVMIEPGVRIIVNGKELLMNGKPPQFRSDSIALSPDGADLYYKAVTANTLYRVPTAVLRDSGADAASAVQNFANIFPTDGIWMDERGSIYLSDVTRNAVQRMAPDGVTEMLFSDDRLQWPDTFTEGPDGSLYISASHINESPPFNDGISTRTQPYGVYRFSAPF